MPREWRIGDKNYSADKNLGYLEQNKKEPVAIWGPETTVIKPKHL